MYMLLPECTLYIYNVYVHTHVDSTVGGVTLGVKGQKNVSRKQARGAPTSTRMKRHASITGMSAFLVFHLCGFYHKLLMHTRHLK